jgi:hypothetical protein
MPHAPDTPGDDTTWMSDVRDKEKAAAAAGGGRAARVVEENGVYAIVPYGAEGASGDVHGRALASATFTRSATVGER